MHTNGVCRTVVPRLSQNGVFLRRELRKLANSRLSRAAAKFKAPPGGGKRLSLIQMILLAHLKAEFEKRATFPWQCHKAPPQSRRPPHIDQANTTLVSCRFHHFL